MNSRFPPGGQAAAILLGLLALGTSSCRQRKEAKTVDATIPAAVVSELGGNSLGEFPGAVYHSQAKSPIQWQPWTRKSMERARAANRLVFAVIAMPQQPGFQAVLAALDADPARVATINEDYVPVLVDGDAAREMGLLTASLCSEIRQPLQLPLFCWMTPEGDPVAWIPVRSTPAGATVELFQQSNSMVSQTWRDDPNYVMKNSSMDAANRRERFSKRNGANKASEKPAEDVIAALRRMTSLYDPISRVFNEAGGLFPAGAIDLMATAALQPGIPAEVRERCRETTRELLVDLLPSAIFDPLDGGVFSARRGNSWALPSFSRDCVSQARVTVALLHGYRATGEKRALDQALELILFAEKSYQTTEGLFAIGMADESKTADWLWTTAEITKALPPEDAAWWIKATAMKDIGNLPSEVDTQREYFRGNSLSIPRPLAEIAAELGLSLEAFMPRFEKSRQTLLKVRETKIGPRSRDESSHAASTFRMVSAYAAAFAATGEAKYRDQAVALLGKARTAFSDGPKLREFSKPAPASLGGGRAFIYGLALQAALDVSAITSDETWLIWSEDLATTAAEQFTGEGFLRECPQEAEIIRLPITDATMLFDDSSAGLISFAECRLAERGRPLVQSFSDLATPLPAASVDVPITHTDLLQASLAREFKVTVVVGKDLPDDLSQAIERLPIRMIQRRAAKSTDEIPAGSVTVSFSEGESLLVSSVADLQDAVSPHNP